MGSRDPLCKHGLHAMRHVLPSAPFAYVGCKAADGKTWRTPRVFPLPHTLGAFHVSASACFLFMSTSACSQSLKLGISERSCFCLRATSSKALCVVHVRCQSSIPEASDNASGARTGRSTQPQPAHAPGARRRPRGGCPPGAGEASTREIGGNTCTSPRPGPLRDDRAPGGTCPTPPTAPRPMREALKRCASGARGPERRVACPFGSGPTLRTLHMVRFVSPARLPHGTRSGFAYSH